MRKTGDNVRNDCVDNTMSSGTAGAELSGTGMQIKGIKLHLSFVKLSGPYVT